jgi:hypothetical protein
MKKPDALQHLGALARDQEAEVDPRWDALARGELSAEELAELERQAEADPEIALRLELFRPLSNEARDRIANSVEPKAAVVPIESRRPLWQKAALVMAPLAAAAAIALMLLRPAPLAPLPGYTLSASGGESELRSPAPRPGPVVLAPDASLTLVLRPATSVEGPVAARFFVEREGALEPLAVRAEQAEGGSLRLSAPARELFGTHTGDASLIAIVGRPAAINEDPQALVRGAPANGPGWQRVAIAVKLVAEH